ADLDDGILRGSDAYQPQTSTYTRWSGFYAGGQFGYGTTNADFTNAVQTLVAFAERDSVLGNGLISGFPVLSTQDAQGKSYGFFFGYNTQWDAIGIGYQ